MGEFRINMSFLLNCLVVVLAAASVAQGQAQLPDFVKLGEIVQRCRQETGATNEDIQNIFMRRVPETRSGQCMLACAGEGLGVMHDGALDADGTLAIAGRLLEGRDQRIRDAVRNAIKTCAQTSDTRRVREKKLNSYLPFKPALNGVDDGYSDPSAAHSMKTLHSKSSSYYIQPNHRVRRQSGQNQGNSLSDPIQPSPYVPQTQQQPNQQYPNNQQYPFQTNQNNPVDQSLAQIAEVFNPLNPAYNYPYNQPYVQPYAQPYAQPVIVATPYAGVPVLTRGKRSPQEVVLTSAEIDIPPEIADQISARLRELLMALISAQDGSSLNSTDVTEKDAEVIESVTSVPRKRRQTSQANQQELPLGPLLDVVRNGPIHQIMQNFQNRRANSTNEMKMNSTTTTTSTPAPAKTS